MADDLQKEADARLSAALEGSDASDPREGYRTLLKELRTRSESDYDDAVREYRSTVVEPIARGEAEPVRTWLEFGCRLAARLHAGRAVVLSAAGRVRPYEPPPEPDAVILHVPEDRRAQTVVVGLPRRPTPAQAAAVDLLAYGRVKRADA